MLEELYAGVIWVSDHIIGFSYIVMHFMFCFPFYTVLGC
jgi:hypothetical protein